VGTPSNGDADKKSQQGVSHHMLPAQRMNRTVGTFPLALISHGVVLQPSPKWKYVKDKGQTSAADGSSRNRLWPQREAAVQNARASVD
jgi:hypothetical protein